jgi:uncharacterized membrane-anchored protein
MNPTVTTTANQPETPARDAHAHAKVPEITPWFWATKIVGTAMGEAVSDFMNAWLGPAIAVPIMLIALGLLLRWQYSSDRYNTWRYWSVVTAVAVFGTSAADALHVGLGIPYVVSTAFYAVVLAIVLIAWYRSEGTLSVHSIYTRRRENFYWLTVLATFALGTAWGDFTATSLNIGFFPSALLFGALILVPLLAYTRLRMNAVVAFWFAYTLTRPLGASFADWFDQPRSMHGLNLGQGPIAISLAVVLLALITYMSANQVGVRRGRPVSHLEPTFEPAGS